MNQRPDLVPMENKHRPLLQAGLESKEYFCGEPIFMANFTLVGRDDSKFAIEKEFFSRFVVRTELTCDSYIDKKYYSNQTAMEGVEMLCYRCGENLSERPDIIASILKERENFHCVLPTCKSAGCGRMKCERKKKVKRSAPNAKSPPAKRSRK